MLVRNGAALTTKVASTNSMSQFMSGVRSVSLIVAIAAMPAWDAVAQSGYNWNRYETAAIDEARDIEEAVTLTGRRGILEARIEGPAPANLDEFVENYSMTDPYVEVFPAAFEPLVAQQDQILGYGIKLLKDEDRILMLVRPDTPAADAGFSGAYYLNTVNDRVATAQDFETVVAALGAHGRDTVRLNVRSLDSGLTVSRSLRKRLYTPRTAQQVRGYDLPMIRILDFAAGKTEREVASFLRAIPANGPLILDLRYCNGGELQSAVNVAQLFLGPNASLGMSVDREGAETAYVTGAENRAQHTGTLIVYSSANTMSAAEFLLRALSHNRDVRIAGERTNGKCFAQSTFRLASGRHLRFSTAALFGPDRSACAGDGIVPDEPTTGGLTHATHELVRRSRLALESVRYPGLTNSDGLRQHIITPDGADLP